MVSFVTDIQRSVFSKYIKEELQIEAKLRHLSLHPTKKDDQEVQRLERQREKEHIRAQKRNRDILKVNKTEKSMSGGDSDGPPLDFSFKNLLTIDGLQNEKPRRGVKGYKKSKAGRFLSTALRLNNNHLSKIDGISNLTNQLLEYPERLTWLDLSFNKLADVPQELTSLPNLKIIYLHGNHLADLPSVLRTLKKLLELYSLTLHGNPVEERRGYRNKVLVTLPHLKSLDFNNITAADRKRVASLKKK